MKALIEKNTWSGIEEYYRHMGEPCAWPVWNSEYARIVETKLIFFHRLCVLKTESYVLCLVQLELMWPFLSHVL